MIYVMSGGGTGATWTITGVVGATVTVTGNGKTYTKTIPASGKVEFKGLSSGTWTATMAKSGESPTSLTRVIDTDYEDTMAFGTVPIFTYTGSYELVDDNDAVISNPNEWNGHWKIRFLTSGTLKFTNLKSITHIDVFLVGAGGGVEANGWSGGGGGGYTLTAKRVQISTNINYTVTIGAGSAGNNGGDSIAFGKKAAGGKKCPKNSTGHTAGNGGSGACCYVQNNNTYGGSDGGNSWAGTEGGLGQRNNPGPNGETGSTREFGESDGNPYSGGGGGGCGNGYTLSKGGDGGGGNNDNPGANNTGGGAGGHSMWATNKNALAGGSGIVIIRDAR